jgi:P-type conjugative transfer protein TrbJ
MTRPRILPLCLVASLALAQPTYAFFGGGGGIVYDPQNHAENILTATRTLEQINNQITQLANEAQMLVNQADNLANLPTSVAGDLQVSLSAVDGLIRDAQGIAYDVSEIDSEYRRLFPEEYGSGVANSWIIQDAQDAWQNAREGYRHSLQVQAEVVGQVRIDAGTLDRLMAESQSAVGNLQAVQAGNQLTALAAKQSMQLQTLLAASTRADALSGARDVATREQARARFENFMGDGSNYTR